jgi:hypothetical protein
MNNNSAFLQPQTSNNFVFALSPTNNMVAIIDSSSLAIRSVNLPAEPLSLAVIPGTDAAVIVEHAGESVSFLSCSGTGCNLQSQRTARHYPGITVSGDGLWAILYTPDPQVPDEGAEGIVAIVNVAQLAAGAPAPIIERATGRRDTNAFFRMVGGVAVDAVVIGEDAAAVINLASLTSQPLPQMVQLPSDYTSIDSRQAVASPDGAWALFRSFSSRNVGVFDVAGQQFTTLPMAGTPTDLELSQDGSAAVVVLRDTGLVTWFPLPGALTDSTQIQTTSDALPADDCPAGSGGYDAGPLREADAGTDADGGAPADAGTQLTGCVAFAGQAALSNDGHLAVLFTNVRETMAFATLNLETGTVSDFTGLEKWVNSLGIGPDGHSVIVLHTPNANSTASDPYQQMVDKSQGFSLVDLNAGFAQLNLTNAIPPQLFVFSSDSMHAAVTLTDGSSTFGVDAIDLTSLVTSSLPLAAAPQFAGPFNGSTPVVWVSQDDPAGRVSFVNLDTQQVQTATGFALNSGITP